MTDRTDAFEDHLNSESEKRKTDARIKAMQKVLDEYKMRIDGLLNPKVTLPKRRRRLGGKKSFRRVVFSDLHGSMCDQKAVAAFINDMKILKPQETICLGDILDCGGFLAQHHTMGYVAQTNYSFEDDIHVGNGFLDQILPHTGSLDLVMGNHGRRTEQWCVTTGLKMPTDQEWLTKKLLEVIDVPNVLALEKRGINFIKQGETVEGEYVPAMLRKGKSIYIHTGSERGGANPQKMLQQFKCNVAYGHTHQQAWKPLRIGTENQVIVARNPGCLCRLQPLWQHTNPSKWNHGYLLEYVGKEDGSFWSIPVPIIDGVSLLSQFTDVINL